MKKYVTLNSKEVQEALFKAGFIWNSDSSEMDRPDIRFLFLNTVSIGRLSYANSFSFAVKQIINENFIAIDPEDIIKNPFQFDGAIQPEKMIQVGGKEYSESTLKAAMKAYVN